MVARDEAATPMVRGASVPGGMAPHIRVQYQPHHQAGWQLFAVCASRQQATNFLVRLQLQGCPARLVAYRCCPTAA